jgi:hypothetical protein
MSGAKSYPMVFSIKTAMGSKAYLFKRHNNCLILSINCWSPHFLVVLPDLGLPCLLGPEVVLRLVAQHLHRRNVQVHQDVPEQQQNNNIKKRLK